APIRRRCSSAASRRFAGRNHMGAMLATHCRAVRMRPIDEEMLISLHHLPSALSALDVPEALIRQTE
ncbi:hypothetical protein ACC754_44365, partial [Rhizobium johnstonii]